ncbi:AAA family ATPase [Uniformispora flossi]|uniref:AAA family ATPase n=2 Tax=Uniformispora flossi TaxID=3390723 RepID=UPI003C2E262E
MTDDLEQWFIYRGPGSGGPRALPVPWPEAPPWRRFGGIPADDDAAAAHAAVPAVAPAPVAPVAVVPGARGDADAPPNGAGPKPPPLPADPPPPADRPAAHAPAAERPTLQEDYVARTFHLPAEQRTEILLAVNAAIRLRRPLLVTGPPGAGKTSLAMSIAYELDLGPVLRWGVTSRTTLRDGLYEYDALGRIHDLTLARGGIADNAGNYAEDIGNYLRLGPLGEALVPRRRPRVLLIDEFDKGDSDLANDLLHVFETGTFDIPELQRHREESVPVRAADRTGPRDRRVEVVGGRVECAEFPVVVLTSNRERDFPAAFHRRCLRLELQAPTKRDLQMLLERHTGYWAELGVAPAAYRPGDPVETFAKRAESRTLSSDQLLHTAFLDGTGAPLDPLDAAGRALLDIVMGDLHGGG